jgi:hypothetical protein
MLVGVVGVSRIGIVVTLAATAEKAGSIGDLCADIESRHAGSCFRTAGIIDAPLFSPDGRMLALTLSHRMAPLPVPALANLLVFDLELLLKDISLIPAPSLPRLIFLPKLSRLKG